MAFQTQDHTTQSPSGTASASAATATDNDSPDGAFSITASPPLILAFLAVGMFIISMAVFFGWRRMSAGRTWVPPGETVFVGREPKLWDVWSPREQSQNPVTPKWCNIQPLGATVWDHTPPAPPNDPPQHHSLAAEALAHLRRRYRRRRSRDDALPDPEIKVDHAAPLVRLQIAVTIAMPCLDSPRAELDDDDRRLEYSIGLYEMPWKKTH
ncbi:hypothetical protein K438DRAFT_1964479 [Mycena galopus ATCC 62051]|nr:hypothetical protein K438DRAFT_1964479 [Mycena galopus ATCC 62051]